MKPTTDIVEELRLYNRWRRGDEAITAPDPTALGKLLDDAADRIEHLFASGIHTCHADCQRPMCVLRRERDKAHADLARVTADNSSLAERLTAAELERDRLGAELEELQGSHDLNQIASDALNDLRADLARVTAELEHHKSVKETIDSAHKELSREHAALRAHVADQRKYIDSCNDLTAERDGLQRRNAELVAALRPIYALRKNCEGDIGWRGQKDAKVGWVTVRDILALEQALARAESATPAKQEVSR